MVAIVAGKGLGLFNTSLNSIGPAGVLGQSTLGRGSYRAILNVVNGNLVLQTQDAQLAGRGTDLFALRTYNSLGTPTDGDKDGWRWGYEQTVKFEGPGAPLQPEPGSTVVRTDGDGHETPYTWDPARAAFVGTEGSDAHDELRYDGGATEWVWVDGSTRVTERYSDSTASAVTGRLVRRTDTSNNSIELTYDTGRLTGIRDTASDQELRLAYGQVNGLTRLQRLEALTLIEDANGHATATLGDPLLLAEYDYDGQGRLKSATKYLAPAGPGFITTFGYDDSSLRIASLTQSDGSSVSFTYDAAGRVSAVKDLGGAPAAQLTLDYGFQPNSTAITDGKGQVWTYQHDVATGHLTEVVPPTVGGTAPSTAFLYDNQGNLAKITDLNNNAVTFGYDDRGNRALERDASGNTTTRTFSELNQVLTETRFRVADPDGPGLESAGDPATTRYVYDANARLRFVVSAEGRVNENRYGSPSAGPGLLTQSLLYIGQVFDVTALGPTQPLTETQLIDWVAGLPDKTQVQLTEYSYDLRGNMSQQTSYATVSVVGVGILDDQASVAEYVYDAYSQLRQRIAVRGNNRDQRTVVTSLAYDGIGRVLIRSSGNGPETTVYDDSSRRVITTTASGLTETREYDNRGRLVRVSQAGDGSTRHTHYVYDTADRLSMVEDAQEGRRYRLYDAVGRLEFKVDATGAVTRFELDAAGHIVRQTQYLNRADTGSWYDDATKIVTKEGLTVGGVGNDVMVDAAHDRVTTFDYDEAGRLTKTTDPLNKVTKVAYDGLSRVVMTQTGDRVTRYLYDKDSRQVGMVDALGYFTEHKYDAGGRLIETVRYSQRSPAAANMTAPVWIGATHQMLKGGRRFEYRVPAYDADGDPLTFSLVGGAPAWLTFDTGTATLRGVPPAAASSHSITLRADDGRGKSSDVTLQLSVNPAAASTGPQGAGPVWAPLSPLDIVANTPVSHLVPAAEGPSLTYSVVGGIPSGLSFNATARTITGASSAVGFYSILLRAQDASGNATERTLSVRICEAPTGGTQPAGSDQPSAWRPADMSALHSYLYYDGQGRVVGAVDEQGFLTETVYDETLNTQRVLRYLTAITVGPGDNLASLKSRAGTIHQISLVQYDGFGRVLEITGPDGSTVTRHEYDLAGRLTRVVSASGTDKERGRRMFYNAFGEVTATLGGEGDASLGTNPSPEELQDVIRDSGTRYEYDTLGRMVRSIDANGNLTLLYYDRENRLTHNIHVIGESADNSLAGEVSETTYNTFGQAVSVRRYAARIAAADMNQLLVDGGGLAGPALLGMLAALVDASADELNLSEYDRCGRLMKQVDGENGFVENIYNIYGELAAQVRSTREGRTTTTQFDYDLNGRIVSQTADVSGINANTGTDYDAFGRVIRSVDGTGRAITTAYEEDGRSVLVIDGLQRTSLTKYDALGRMSRQVNALGQETLYTYEDAARRATETSPEGRKVTTVRTRHDEIESITDGRGNVTRFEFNRDGHPTTVTDALNRVITRTTYDKSGRRFETTDGRGTVMRFGYDQRNRVVEQRVDPAGLNLTTLIEFDALGQQSKVTEAAGSPVARVTAYSCDRKGRTTTVVVDADAGGLELCTTQRYDDLDNPMAVNHGTIASPNQHVKLYEYDNLGRRVKEIIAPGSVFGAGAPGTRDITTQERYDGGGRLTRRIDANGGSTWYVYDAAGQLIHSVSALGDVTQNRYDAAGRLVFSRNCHTRLAAATIASFGDIAELAVPAPTPFDRRSHIVYDGNGQVRFRLHAMGEGRWVISENRYDAGGNVVEARVYNKFLPSTQVVALDSAASPGITMPEIQEELRTMGYLEEDPATLAGVQCSYFAYDANNRLRYTVDPSGSVIESVYDAAGNVIATVHFSVRPALTEHTVTAIDAAVDRDNPDNRVTRQVYDAAHRMRYMVDTLGSVSENEYDARSNVVTTKRWATRPGLTEFTEAAISAALASMPIAKNDEITHFVYDAGNRVRFTIDPTGSVSENVYDALGNVTRTIRFARRPSPPPTTFTEDAISAAVGPMQAAAINQVTRFAYNAAQRLRFAVDPLGSVTERTYDANSNLLAATRFVVRPTLAQFDEASIAAAVAPLYSNAGNRSQRFAYDALNRLRFTIDPTGSVSERIYDALGNLTATVGFAVRPPLVQTTEAAINAAVAPEGGHPDNRVEHQLFDAYGHLRFSVLRVSVEAGQSKYQVTEHKLNAFGQAVSSTSYVTVMALNTVSAATIMAAIGGDPTRDRVSRFVYDLAGRLIYQLQAVTVEADRIKYRVSAQAFDAFGQLVASTDYALPVSLNVFDELRVSAAVQGVADPARDRVSAVVHDALGRAIYNVRVLSPDIHQVTKQEYSPLGRMFRTTQYANAIGALTGFDRMTIEAAAAAVATDADRQVQYGHDAAGRQRFVLQADKTGHWTVSESRYDALGNLVESRRYDHFITDAKIAALDATRPEGVLEQDVTAQLASLGYGDATPATLAGIQRSRFAYDRQNRLRFTIDALGSVVEQVYNPVGDHITSVRFASRPSLATYTERAINTAVDRDNPGNRVQHVAHDAAGRVRFNVQVIKPNVGSTGEHWVNERRYDALGRLAESVVYARAVVHLDSYDEATLAANVVADPANDRRSVIAYDAGGRPAFTLRALLIGPDEHFIVTQQVHDALGQVVKRMDYASPVALTQFDVAAVESAVVPNLLNYRMTTYIRDAAGRLRFEIRPDLSFRESIYDTLDQVLEDRQFDFGPPIDVPQAEGEPINLPLTEVEMVAGLGNHAIGDGRTRGLAHSYDAGGRLFRTIDAMGNPEHYEYDALGNRRRWIDKNHNTFTCAYDRKGRKTVETTPPLPFKLRGEEMATPPPDRELETRFEYDAFGNMIRQIEAANFPSDASTTDFEFDTVGRPTRTFYNGFYDAVTGAVEADPAPDRFRLEASILYDPMGNAVRTSNRTAVDAFQHTWCTYDPQGHVIHEINALNYVTRYTYNTFGAQETVTRYSLTLPGAPQNGANWTAGEVDPQLNYGLDEGGNVMEDDSARTIRLAYDTLGRKIAVTLPAARFYSTHMPGDADHANYFRPNPAPPVPSVQDAQVTRYEYNAFGDLTLQRVRANTIDEWQDTAFTYNGMGHCIKVVNAAGHVTTFDYNLAGNLTYQREINDSPSGTRVTRYEYNVLDQQVRVDRYRLRYTDADGVEHGVISWTWENGGQWLDPDALVATTVRTATYDGYGRPLAVTDPAGNETTMRYNALGQLVEVIGPASLVAPLGANGEDAVDPFRNQVSEALVTSMTLDAFGRPVRQVRATSQNGDPRETLQSYDAAGNLVSTTDAEGHVKLRACDYAGRVIRETQAIHAEMGPLGINEQGLERRYVYDALGQLTDTLDVYVDGTDLVQSGKSAVYNAFGEVAQEQRKWGPASEGPATLNTAVAARYFYDNAGHVIDKKAADGRTFYFYNLLGQVTREVKGFHPTHRVTEYQYDMLGRAIMIRRPEFDADVNEGGGDNTQRITPYSLSKLDRWGNVISTEEGGYESENRPPTYPTNRSRGFAYDDNNRVVKEQLGTHEFVSATGDSAQATIAKRTFRDLLGNVVKEVDEAREPQTEELLSSRTRHKQYDGAGRLTAEIDATKVKVEYAYSVHGERLGTRNGHGSVLFDRIDRNGNIRFHGVLRTSSPDGTGEYNSHAGTGALVRTNLAAYQYDQANRRFARKTFTKDGDAPWSYTWLDGRNFDVYQYDVMGILTQIRFDPFGNKEVESDGRGTRSQWNASTEDFAVGRIETYQLPGDNFPLSGRYHYNDFGELRWHSQGNEQTEYVRHLNGLVHEVIFMPYDTTPPFAKMNTRYEYDMWGQLKQETRSTPDSVEEAKIVRYDNVGRLSRVRHRYKTDVGGSYCHILYAYDQWSNVRSIKAWYIPSGQGSLQQSDGLYDYDEAGRMKFFNRDRTRGLVGGISIIYDKVGRRSRTTKFVRTEDVGNASGGRKYDKMRDESYVYDDLGHLCLIEQRIRHANLRLYRPKQPVKSLDDVVGDWMPLSKRVTNLRGDVISAEKWTDISRPSYNWQIDQQAKLESTTTTSYRADGQPAKVLTDYSADENKNTEVHNSYNEKTGLLDWYVFKAKRSDGASFATTIDYSYTLQNGMSVVKSIRDIQNGLVTDKTYNSLGQLSWESIDLAKPNGSGIWTGSDRREQRRYTHSADGRIIFKRTYMQLTENNPTPDNRTQPLPDPSTGQQTYVYVGNRIVGTVGAERLEGSTNFHFAYTPISEIAGSGRAHYVVQNDDSLINIAQAHYGDGALWYLIAEANGITDAPGEPLPATEVGRAYEIPNAVRSSQTSSTFTPFGMGQIIGNDRPLAIPLPPRPRYSQIEMLGAAAAPILIQVVVTAGLLAVGVPAPVSFSIGAGLGNLTGQATAPGKDGIDWESVGITSLETYLFSVMGPYGTLGRETWQQNKSGFSGWTSGPGLNWTGIGGSLFNVGFGALGPVLGGPSVGKFNFSLGGLINSAYNPRSGWAIQDSGRSPIVGAFEFAFGEVANGLASVGFEWIRKRLESPSAPVQGPGSLSGKEPLPEELIDLWDEIDRLEDEERDQEAQQARYARNGQIAAASDESLDWQLRFAAMADSIAHFGENIDDRAIILAGLRQQRVERLQLKRAAALSMARLKLNTARVAAQHAESYQKRLKWARENVDEMEELNRYIEGQIYGYLEHYEMVDGLVIQHRAGRYEKRIPWQNSTIKEMDSTFEKLRQQDPTLLYNEIIVIEDIMTPAVRGRLSQFDHVQTFDEFSKSYANIHGSLEGVEREFLKYHDQKSREISHAWYRMRNAYDVTIVTGATYTGMAIAPIGTVASIAGGYIAEKALGWAGVPEEVASGVGSLVGELAGAGISSRLIRGTSRDSVKHLLREERAARAEYDAARVALRLNAPATSQGLTLGGGVLESGSLRLAAPYEATGVAPILRDPGYLGSFEPRLGTLAHITDGGGGFMGGKLSSLPKPPRILGDILSGKSAAQSAEVFMHSKPTAKMVQAELRALEADAAALGYSKVHGRFSRGQPVFEKAVQGPGPNYISPDIGSGIGSGGTHTGGVWKGANTIKDLGKKETRLGTYDSELKNVGE